MVFGPLPRSLECFQINDQQIRFSDCVKYVGVTFQSTAKDYFASHYTEKLMAAHKNIGALFALELFIGCNRIPPSVARMLYFALVDCHLIHAADIAPDVSPQLLAKFTDLQKRCLRRILLISKHSVIAPLYTETGVMPIAPRRVLLALRYLNYLVNLPDENYSSIALQQSEVLRNRNLPSWLADLNVSLRNASHGTLFLPPLRAINPVEISRLSSALQKHVWSHLYNGIKSNRRLYLIHDRLEPLPDGSYKHIASKLCHYLVQVALPDHRRCLSNLLFGFSAFRSLSLHGVSENARSCRVCNDHRETPEHALLQYPLS